MTLMGLHNLTNRTQRHILVSLNHIHQSVQSTTTNRTHNRSFKRRQRMNRHRRSTVTLTGHRPQQTTRLNTTRVFRIPRSQVHRRPLRMVHLHAHSPNNRPHRNVQISTQETTHTTLVQRRRARVLSHLHGPSITQQIRRPKSNPSQAALRRRRRERVIVRILKNNRRTMRRTSQFPIGTTPQLVTNPVGQRLNQPVLSVRPQRMVFNGRHRAFPFVSTPQRPAVPCRSQFRYDQPTTRAQKSSRRQGTPHPAHHVTVGRPTSQYKSNRHAQCTRPCKGRKAGRRIRRRTYTTHEYPMYNSRLRLFRTRNQCR